MRTKTVTMLSLLCATALVLGYIESFVPIFSLLPGGKIGIANTVTMVVFCLFGARTGILFGALRCLLSAVLYQGLSAFFYGFGGTIFAVLFMWIFQKMLNARISPIGLSVVSAAFFNVGQLAVCALVLNGLSVFYYLPALLAVSALSGVVTGAIAKQILELSLFTNFYKNRMER